MSSLAFDTHAYVKKLRAVGVPEEQAEVHAEMISGLITEQLATKRDLMEMELRLKYDLTLRIGAMMAASIAIVAALVKLL